MVCTKDDVTGDQLDISGAQLVEINVRKDRKTIWINVDGICRLRVSQIEELEVEYNNR